MTRAYAVRTTYALRLKTGLGNTDALDRACGNRSGKIRVAPERSAASKFGTFVDVKLYGRKTLKVEHRIDRINGAKIVAMEPRDVPTVEFAVAMNLTLPLSRPLALDPV